MTRRGAAVVALLVVAAAALAQTFGDTPKRGLTPIGFGDGDGALSSAASDTIIPIEDTTLLSTALAYYWANDPVLDPGDEIWLGKYDLLILDAYRYDDLSGGTWAALRRANPDIKVLLYKARNVANWQDDDAIPGRNTVARYEDAEGHSLGAFSDNTDFYMTASGGVRVYNTLWSDPPDTLWIPDPSAADWADWYAEALITDMVDQDWSADGLFCDEFYPGFNTSQYSATPTELTEAQYRTAQVSNISAVSADLQAEGALIAFNRTGTLDADVAESWWALDAAANPPDYVMEEAGFASSWHPTADTQIPSMNQWRRVIRLLNGLENSGVVSFNHTKLDPGESGQDQNSNPITYEQSLWFAMASFLVGTRGGDDYFCFSGEDIASGDHWHDEYDELYLGAPADTNQIVPYTWQEWRWREYENGYVLVNPTSDAIQVNLPGDGGIVVNWSNFDDYSKATAQDTLTIQSRRGYIVMKEE